MVLALLAGIPVVSFGVCWFFFHASRGLPWFRARRIQAKDPSRTQIKSNLISMIGGRALDIVFFFVLLLIHPIYFDAKTPVLIDVLTCLGLYIWFEIWFFHVHRALHHRWFFRWHREHHREAIVYAYSSYAVSIVEHFLIHDCGILLPLTVIGLFRPVPAYGYFIFVYSVVLFDTFGHCNLIIFPAMTSKPWPLSYFTDSSSHFMHHRNPRANFGFTLHFLDRHYDTYTIETVGLRALDGATDHQFAVDKSTNVAT